MHPLSALLTDRAEDVACAILGEPTSRTPREMRFGRKGSLAVDTKRGIWCDHEAGTGGDLLDLIQRERGVDFARAVEIAQSLVGGGHVAPSRREPRRAPQLEPHNDRDDIAERVAYALGTIWRDVRPPAGTLSERYLIEHRDLDVVGIELAHAVGHHAGTRAMVALMTDPLSAAPCGVHRTFLDGDGRKLERKMIGRQGVIRLSPDEDVTTGLGICEGVEDGLAILLCGWVPIWAATSAGAIARFPVLAGIECLTIFADADDAGTTAATTCAARWRDAGRETYIRAPEVLA